MCEQQAGESGVLTGSEVVCLLKPDFSFLYYFQFLSSINQCNMQNHAGKSMKSWFEMQSLGESGWLKLLMEINHE